MGKRNVMFLMLLFLTLVPLTTAYDFCESITSRAELEIEEIIYQEQADETTWAWEPTEELNIEVIVKNKNFTERDFDIELFLLDENDKIEKFVSNLSDTTKTVSLDKDQTKTLNFSFQLKEGISGTYSLHAKLIDANNESICTSLEAASIGDEVTIEIKPEEKIIVVRNINGPTNVTAGSNVEYIVEVINLGNVKEDRVLVIAYNAKFSIREEREIINLGAEESKSVTFNFTIPENATTQEEIILFSTEYDYQNKTGFYYQSSYKSKIFLLQIEALGNQIETQNQTQNQTQTNQTQTNQTLPSTTEETTTETTEEESDTSYLGIIITISLILIITGIFFFLKYKGTPEIKTPSEAPTTAASDYVKKIQDKSVPRAKPVQPVKPTKPIQPAKPVQPTQPVQPAKPVQPTRPTPPIDPNKPS